MSLLTTPTLESLRVTHVADDLPPGWVKIESTQYPGRFYYYNDATQTTQWERPTEQEGAASPRPEPAPAPESSALASLRVTQVAEEEEKELPPGWVKRESTQYPGSYFYYHGATNTTQWERPTEQEGAAHPVEVSAPSAVAESPTTVVPTRTEPEPQTNPVPIEHGDFPTEEELRGHGKDYSDVFAPTKTPSTKPKRKFLFRIDSDHCWKRRESEVEKHGNGYCYESRWEADDRVCCKFWK